MALRKLSFSGLIAAATVSIVSAAIAQEVRDMQGDARISVIPIVRINGLAGAPGDVFEVGAVGTTSADLRYPNNAASDAEGNIYVADSGNDRVVVLDPNGRFRFSIGEFGHDKGQFHYPMDVAVDLKRCRIYVADAMNNRVQAFSCKNGDFEGIIGEGDRRTGEGLNSPHGLTVDQDGSVIVADTVNHRIVRYSPDGEELAAWGSFGSERGFMQFPHDVEVDANGNIFVTDFVNHRIQVFDREGKFVTTWGSLGDRPGEFNHPWGVAIDTGGRIWVTDMSNHRIQVFDNFGKFVALFGRYEKVFGGGEAAQARLPLERISEIVFDHPKGLHFSDLPRTQPAEGRPGGLLVVSVPGSHSVDLFRF